MNSTPPIQSPIAATLKNKVTSVLAVALFVSCLLAEGAYCYRHPISSFDTLAYVSIVERSGPQGFANAGLRCASQLPGDHNLCAETASSFMYKRVAGYSAADYTSFLRFYQVKPLYTWLLQGLHQAAHTTAYGALRVVSTISFMLTGGVLWLWLKQHLSFVAASLVATFLISSPTVLNLGKNLLPDALSTFLLVGAVFAVLYVRPLWLGLVALVLLPLARPDNLIFATAFAGAIVYRSANSRQTKMLQLALLGVGCAVYGVLLQYATPALPWSILFTRSFITWIDPASFAAKHVSPMQYADVLASNGVRTVLFCLPVSAVLATLALAAPRSWQPLRDLVCVSVVALAIRILLFPGVEERYYVWFYLVCGVAAAAAVAELAKGEGSWFPAHRSVQVAP